MGRAVRLSARRPPSKVRRAPRYVKMAVAAAAQAIADAHVGEDPACIGTIFSTGYGPVESNVTFADSVAEGVPALVSPTVFSYTVPNSCLGQVCIVNGFQGSSTLLIGGEPLVRRDFWDLVDLLMDEKIYIEEIFSNGLLITDAFLDKLERRNIKLNSFLLSFDGVGRHDWMRGLHGAEGATIRTIKRLKSRGYGVIVTTVLHEQSMDCLTDTYHRMKALDVDYWRVADVVNTGNWKKTQNTEVKTTALLDAYVNLIAQMKRDGMPFRAVKLAGCVSAHGADYSLPALGGCGTKAQENEHLCEASKLFPHLLPDGRLLPCMPMCGTEMEEHAPNILTGDYDISKALIDSPLGKYMQYTYRDVFLHEEECRRCPHKYQCNRCPATSLLYGSLFAKSPLTCAFIKQNYAERIRDVMERAG